MNLALLLSTGNHLQHLTTSSFRTFADSVGNASKVLREGGLRVLYDYYILFCLCYFLYSSRYRGSFRECSCCELCLVC
jgi:hypothetical protein